MRKYRFKVQKRSDKQNSFCKQKTCNCRDCVVCLTSLTEKHRGIAIKDNNNGRWFYVCSKACRDMLIFQEM